ncbi:MAG: 4-hydroxy-tetrahydrodipicolinate synthase [Rikenellaceae bacterium]|nr:4-hydroxy-tetrahydrodipicolinate synthase [Rikenellaceae bacterium]
MTITNKFTGVGVALITPFDSKGSIDFGALAAIIDRVIDGGVDYLLALGTTSETPTLTPSERVAVAKFIAQRVSGRVPLMVGIGGNCTADVVATLRSWDFTGYDAVLSVNPYYNKPNQEGLYLHFKALSEASPLPIMLYNIPGRTGVNMTPQTVARIVATCPNIFGIKEASGNADQMEEVVKAVAKVREDFILVSGDDGLTVEAIRRGGKGVLSVLAHLYPADVKSLTTLALEGNFDKAEYMLTRLSAITDSLFAEGNPVGIKNALATKALCTPTVRLPLAKASVELDIRQRIEIIKYES